MYKKIFKRLIDIFLSFWGIVVLSLPMLVIAIAIKIDSKGPVFFKQKRATRDGRVFYVYKFRSMKVNVDNRSATADDDRITKVGKILRKTRLDEIPQFLNIFLGDMSFVGPRPEMLENVYSYTEDLPEFKYRLRVKAGLTGYAQIAGKYNTSPKDKLILDMMYIENYPLMLQALRDVLGEDRIVSVAVGAGEYFVEGTEMDKVGQICNYVQLMTYDMRSGFTHQAGHHASLGLTKGDTTNTSTRGIAEMFHQAGVPFEKMVVGAAFYGRRFDGVPNVNNGLLQSAETAAMGGGSYGMLTEEFLQAGGFTRYWDEDAEAHYLWNGSSLITYESPEAIRRKCLYVKEKGLLGIMYWEHGCDPERVLLDAMYEAMNA